MTQALYQRYRLPLACAMIGLLLAVLLVREGLGRWRDLSQWQALAESAASLQARAPINLERLRQSAESRQIQLAGVEPSDAGWQVHGQVTSEQALQQWLLALQAEGALPLQWALEQDVSGLRFDVLVRP
ncbi:type II secretion system protein GspM [Pseudomonas capeferrum]|uniref:type II secretion system protein GspM n=1 Tax=Pseudomonas capeferrum TaxID=1495066 RepID=UPI0015E3D91F|nr:type II secretion system protein GspM [Pseudomonas capeferrum]MBA1203697.1 type II secretion system protein GspM [Pseudomonas capeferrum]